MKQIRGFRLPDTFSIILIIMVFFLVLTWVVPAGEYQRETVQVNGIAREIVIQGSYRQVSSAPQGVGAFFMAPVKGFAAAAQIIGFCLIVGGAFGILNRTDAIKLGLMRVIRLSRNHPGRKKWIIPGVMVLFSLCGASFGMSESVLVFIMITIPLARALGYDSIVGISISFLAAGVGFAGAFLNPFTIGIAQGISQVSLFSGWEYRIVIWVIFTSLSVVYVMRYAKKIGIAPSDSPVFEMDKGRADKEDWGDEAEFTNQHKMVLGLLFLSFIMIIIGSNTWNWYINEISGMFLCMGILAALLTRLKASETTAAFLSGARDMITAALVIGMSRGLLIIATEGKIIDTMLYAMAGLADTVSPVVSAQLMFVFQGVLNFFVPSGSGQAALTMPVMAPLSDLLGITRQTAVLAFQLGDGIFNMIIPTSGVTMGALSIANIPYQKWVKWVYPFILILLVASLLSLMPPVLWFTYS